MNIFVLDESPTKSAIMMCDKHIVKMILESAQLLCSAFPDNIQTPYKKTHVNHPCAKWVRESEQNFDWLVQHACALNAEYQLRYKAQVFHKSMDIVEWCSTNKHEIRFPQVQRTRFALAMPDEYKVADPVESYRNYYREGKKDIARWERGRNEPDWYRNISDTKT